MQNKTWAPETDLHAQHPLQSLQDDHCCLLDYHITILKQHNKYYKPPEHYSWIPWNICNNTHTCNYPNQNNALAT